MLLRGLHFTGTGSNIWRVVRVIVKTHYLSSTVLDDLIIGEVRILWLGQGVTLIDLVKWGLSRANGSAF